MVTDSTLCGRHSSCSPNWGGVLSYKTTLWDQSAMMLLSPVTVHGGQTPMFCPPARRITDRVPCDTLHSGHHLVWRHVS